MKQEYNGHESWNAWNVSLWISNDEGLYRTAVAALKSTYTPQRATERFLRITGLRGEKTPDGARYSERSVRLALKGLEVEQLKRGA